ncbi:MAG: acyl-CoA dehydrogenase family protein [Deltaproteobacteria bacterium]|nr:acyl-CoA dehydrogenase family protein [Deltaproteobacteria bacterium]MBW2078222.1 acyl-CoA dehydrogenase family protein [Deltaproteobacteria bacterium]MBW2311700.1 acyl-CoA dehydrogenase family protein [Deltaproteobacteria bacterium]
MRFEPTMKQAVIRRTVRNFVEPKLADAAVEMDRTARFPWDLAREMADLQYFGLEIPTEHGGAGLDAVSSTMVVEEISRANAAIGLCITVHNGVSAYPIYLFGTPEQRGRFLPLLASGEKIGTFCLTEPNAGSDMASIQSTATRRGDEYVINGNKVFVTNGGISGINLILARAQEAEGTKGLTVFIVESECEGLEKGPPEELMGMRGNPVCPISLNDCRVPSRNILGREGEGMKVALSSLNGGRIGIGAQALGIAQASLDVSLKYTGQRYQFGKRLVDFETTQKFLADMAIRIEGARLLIYRAAHLKDNGLDYAKESAMAKLYASEVAVEAARRGIQIHGGYGYTKAYPIERYYRDAKVCEIYEGTSEIQRMVIARSLLREISGSKGSRKEDVVHDYQMQGRQRV